MTHTHRFDFAYRLAFALVAGAALLACSQSPAPSTSDADQGFISQHVDQAIAEARKELATENISLNHGIAFGADGEQTDGKSANLPKAEITPQGDLLIEGKPVAVTPQQREQLLAYRGQIIGIAEIGMAIGSQGADLAGEALKGVAGAIFGGEDDAKAFEQRMEAKGEELEAEAQKICALLPPMLSTQQALAASLPEFKPYASMTQQDIDDCHSDTVNTDNAAGRHEVRDSIRSTIRQSIRGAAQAAGVAEGGTVEPVEPPKPVAPVAPVAE